MATESISIPKNVTHVAGPSVYLLSIGRPMALQTVVIVAKLLAHSGEPGLPIVTKSSI